MPASMIGKGKHGCRPAGGKEEDQIKWSKKVAAQNRGEEVGNQERTSTTTGRGEIGRARGDGAPSTPLIVHRMQSLSLSPSPRTNRGLPAANRPS